MYGCFTEGLDSADRRQAQALLEELTGEKKGWAVITYALPLPVVCGNRH